MSYYDAYLIPVPEAKLAAYKAFSACMAAGYREYGALRVVDCLLDPEVRDGAEFHAEGAREAASAVTLRDFHAAADTRPGEVVVLSFTEWPSKAARDGILPRVLADPRVQPVKGEDMVFEGTRLVAGGFLGLLEG